MSYRHNPLPHVLAVTCPGCGGCARFEFATIVAIRLKKDTPFFEASAHFDYQLCIGRGGHRWHGAIFYAGLHGGTQCIDGLPEGYKASDWEHSKHLIRAEGLDEGALTCPACSRRNKHTLDWPEDAYFTLEYKGASLWAFHREAAQELRDFIASPDRHTRGYVWQAFLRKVPTTFKTKKARATVLKRLDRLLASEGG